MTLNEQLSQMWKSCFHPATLNFWREDMDPATQTSGWEPMDITLKFSESEMLEQVVSDCGVILTHYKILAQVPCIGKTREVWQDYYEVWGIIVTDPYFIAGSGNLREAFLDFLKAEIREAFLDFLKAEMGTRIQGWAEAYAEHELDSATGGEGGLGV